MHALAVVLMVTGLGWSGAALAAKSPDGDIRARAMAARAGAVNAVAPGQAATARPRLSVPSNQGGRDTARAVARVSAKPGAEIGARVAASPKTAARPAGLNGAAASRTDLTSREVARLRSDSNPATLRIASRTSASLDVAGRTEPVRARLKVSATPRKGVVATGRSAKSADASAARVPVRIAARLKTASARR